MGRRRIEDVSRVAKAFLKNALKPIKSTRTPVTQGGSRGQLTRTPAERAFKFRRIAEQSAATGRVVKVSANGRKKGRKKKKR